jgi:hypothetical protein
LQSRATALGLEVVETSGVTTMEGRSPALGGPQSKASCDALDALTEVFGKIWRCRSQASGQSALAQGSGAVRR